MAPRDKRAALYAGIDIGGTKILSVIARSDGKRMGTSVTRTPGEASAAEVVDAMARATHAAAQRAGVTISELAEVGVAAAGAIDSKHGTVVHSPHLPAFRQTPVAAMLEDMLSTPVIIGNDANLAALAEHRFGAARGIPHVLFITVSTGIGGGIIIDNRLFMGSTGYAGEVGHITVDAHGPYGKSGTPGAWESLCSGSALVRIVTERVRQGERSSLAGLVELGDELSAVDVFTAYRERDPLAQAVVKEATVYMGAALTSLVNVLNPGMVIVGGGLSNEWEDYIAPAVEIMRKQAFAGVGAGLPVVPPQLGADAGALGAVALAVDASSAGGPGRV